MKKAERVNRFKEIDLYPVLSSPPYAPDELSGFLAELVATPVKIVQLRWKNAPPAEKCALARRFREITRKHNVLLIINDDVQLAVDSGADGVHLGNDDMPVVQAREMAPDLIIGKSTHSVAEAAAAEREGADYINVGPIFPSPTKPGMSAVGMETFAAVRRAVTVPVTVMGGINRDNLAAVAAAGADKIAMVRGVVGDDIRSEVAALYEIYRAAIGEPR